MIPATSLIVPLFAILAAIGDVQRPTQGYQIGNGPGSGFDVIFPLTITQCEPVVIYYNLTDSHDVFLVTPDNYDFLFLYFPVGVGYLDWICDIPTGYSFWVVGYQHAQSYSVQPGSSSACLGDITTTYSYASYYSTYFQSYTQHSPSVDPFYSSLYQLPTVDFPTSSFPTVTVNPNLAVTSTTTTSVSSTSFSPSTSSTLVSSIAFPSPVVSSPASPHKTKKAVIGGGIIGGAAFILLTLALLFIFLQKRVKLRSNAATEALTIKSEPEAYSGLMMSQPGLAYTSAPALPSSDQERHFPHIASTDAVRRESEFTPNIAEAAGMAIHDVPFATLPGNISSSAPIAPPVPPKPENIILSYHPPEQSSRQSRNPEADQSSAFDALARLTASQRQATIASSNASADPAAPSPFISPPVPQSSASIAPPVPPKPENIVSYHPPEHATSESSRNPGTGFASALDAVRALTASEQQALIASLITSTDPAPPEASSQPALPELSTSVATQEDPPDITNILGVISRARLSARERHAMVVSLNTLLAPDQAAPGGLTRGNTVSSPPPYV